MTRTAKWTLSGCIQRTSFWTTGFGLFFSSALAVQAASNPFGVSHSSQYLIIARHTVTVGGTDVQVNNSEVGANKAPVPCPSGFPHGPGLLGAVPNIPCNAMVVFSGIAGDGNVALTDNMGIFNLQNVGLYADIGARLAAPNDSFNTSADSFFNDPNNYPNTFVSKGFPNPCPNGNNNTDGNGVAVDPDTGANQSTRVDPPGNGGFNAGVTFGFDHSALLAELTTAMTTIEGFAITGTLSTGGDGVINTNTKFLAASGLNVIDIDTGGNDFEISNAYFVIDGPADAVVIFKVPTGKNMKLSQANVLIGNSGIGLTDVLFVSIQSQSGTHFNFNNTVINGAAFWSLGSNGGTINVNNAQGCTQLLADNITVNASRFTRCSFQTACDGDADCPPDPAKCINSFCDLTDHMCKEANIPDCCAGDADCPPDPTKCIDSFCDLTDNTCEMAPIPDCCDNDGDCPPDPAKCINSFCDLTDNMCETAAIIPCCASDADCPPDPAKCTDSFCDLTDNVCQTAAIIPCCASDADCPPDPAKCINSFCDLTDNVCETAAIIPCCASDADCPPDPAKCTNSFCDLTDNVCETAAIIPCCASDADCPPDPAKCTDSFCDLTDNVCETAAIIPCCASDADCPPDPAKCTDSFCDLTDNVCKTAAIIPCCASDADCPPDPAKCINSFCDLTDNMCETAPIPGCCAGDADCPPDPAKCINSFCDLTDNMCKTATIPGCCDADDDCDDGVACTSDICDLIPNECVYECVTPGITCPPNKVFECDAVGDFGDPTVEDDCSVNPMAVCTEESTPGKLPQERTIIRTCTVTNDCGNSAQCQQRIDIVDITPPVVTCPLDCTLECGDVQCVPPECDDPSCECGGVATCQDNCSTCTVTVTCEVVPKDCTPGQVAGLTPPPKLTVVRTFTSTDAVAGVTASGQGNIGSCIQRIEIVDTTPPVLESAICPGTITICRYAELSFTPPTCTDTCGTCGVICVRSDNLPFPGPGPSGPITVTCVASDECGNESSCTVDVEVSESGECFKVIPTVSEWGLVILTLLLLTGAKVFFGRRQIATA